MTETEIYNYILDQLVPSDVTIDNDIGIVRSYILYIVENNLKELNHRLNEKYNIVIIDIKLTNLDEITLYISRPFNFPDEQIYKDINILINNYTGFNSGLYNNYGFNKIYVIKDNKIKDLYNKLIKKFKEKLNNINPPQNTIVDGWDNIMDEVESNL